MGFDSNFDVDSVLERSGWEELEPPG